MPASPDIVSPTDEHVVLEVCVDSVESALAAVKGGADRLEICGNLPFGGGATPSVGLVRAVKKACQEYVELMAMIRPRVGDFIYTTEEVEVMVEDITAFADVGITGVVIGALQADGSIDLRTTQALTETAKSKGLDVCFHRAFDMVANQREALNSIICNVPGITRILTSGGSSTAPAALSELITLLELVEGASQSDGALARYDSAARLEHGGRGRITRNQHIEIMPGSGVNARTARPLLRALLPRGLRSIHMSGGAWMPGPMQFRKAGMGMGAAEPIASTGLNVSAEETKASLKEWGLWRTSTEAVLAVRKIADEDRAFYKAAEEK